MNFNFNAKGKRKTLKLNLKSKKGWSMKGNLCVKGRAKKKREKHVKLKCSTKRRHVKAQLLKR